MVILTPAQRVQWIAKRYYLAAEARVEHVPEHRSGSALVVDHEDCRLSADAILGGTCC